jgi:hypothetical protein
MIKLDPNPAKHTFTVSLNDAHRCSVKACTDPQPAGHKARPRNMSCIVFDHPGCQSESIGRCFGGCQDYHAACYLNVHYRELFDDNLGWDSKTPDEIETAFKRVHGDGYESDQAIREAFDALIVNYRTLIADAERGVRRERNAA